MPDWKRFKPLILFFSISFLLVSFFAVFHWYQIKDKKAALPYLSSPEWSQPVEIVPELYSKTYSVVPDQNKFSLFWIEKESMGIVEELIVQENNYHGDLLNKKQLLKGNALRSIGVTRIGNRYHMFYLNGDIESRQSLNYIVFDDNYHKIIKQTLMKNLSYAGNIKTIHHKESIYLIFTSSIENVEHIYLAKFNLNNKKFSSRKITDSTLQSGYPDFTINNGNIHLTWLKQSNVFIPSSKSNLVNNHTLIYQSFKLNLTETGKSIEIGQALADNSMDAPAITFFNNRVYIIWNRANDSFNKHKVLYSASFRPENTDRINITKLTTGPAQAPDAVVSNNRIALAYTRHQIETPIIFAEFNKPTAVKGNFIFPEHKMSINPSLFIDADGHPALLWIELENGGRKLYYATTRYPFKPGFFATLGLKFELENLTFLTTLFYFLTAPFMAIFTNFGYCILIICSVILLYLLGKKIKFLGVLKKLDNPYITYLVILIFTSIGLTYNGSTEPLFFPAAPPAAVQYIIFILVTAAGLVFINRIDCEQESSVLIGSSIGLLWFYWVAQSNLIFHIYKYFY